jgi:DNA helicase II / ATP-dependent DNA helicase PcrA
MLTVSQKLKESYLKEYDRLNENQREAVDAIEGPVMVIAGPGTGKTQILACRIAKILLETDTSPDNILCLTFTDAGVVAMRKRLVQFLGSDAYKVNIHTFHSFCNKVIQEQSRALKKPDLEPLSELERVQFIKELIDSFPNDNPLKRLKGEAYYDLGNLSALFSTMKKEAWDPEFLKEKIDHYIEVTIPENFTLKRNPAAGLTQTGKDEVKKFTRTKAAVGAFPDYQKILSKNARYDFDDMINWVIKLFEEQPEVLLSYQESLQYILVDEYQDTSGSQNKIVELLTSYWEDNPNLFVVGDDDQSIYRFQGANIENMMAIRERLDRNLRTVVLTKNYRSVQPILDAASALIIQNKKRLIEKVEGLTKDLFAAKATLQDLIIHPEVRVYENEFAENAHIAYSVEALVKSGVNPGEIAVLYREHKYGDELQKFLHLAHIPFYVKRSLNLLDDLFVKKILNICRYIDMENDQPNGGEYLLFEMLHYDFFKLDPSDIARITREKKGSLREHVAAVGATQAGLLFDKDETSGKLHRISQMLDQLQKDSFNLPLQQWFEKLINEAGILALITTHEEKVWLMEKLSCLFNYIKEETHRNPLISLREFIQLIDLMVDNDLTLPLIQTTGNETGVNLMSCHGSKGLEFEHVFFLGARSDVWEDKRKNNRGFPLPPSVFEGGDQDAAVSKEEEKEELRRLFFVSITRAEKHLYISYPRMKNDGKELMPSMFLEEIRSAMDLKEDAVLLDDETRLKYQSLRFGIISKPVLKQAEKSYIDGLLARFVMNVSALNNYLDCPIGFYYTNLVKVPGAKSESASFGTAVHAALKVVYDEGKGKDHYPPVAVLQDQFRAALAREREHFSDESFKRYAVHGMNVLAAYYEHMFTTASPPKVLVTEYKLDNVALDDIPLRGFTDLISFEGNDIVITDFKTGDFTKASKSFKKPGEDAKQPYGGNYWRQAVFYKILVDLLPKNWKVQHVEFDFIEPDKNGKWQKQRLMITPEDVILVEQQIREVWEKIRNHDFYTGCGKPDCSWCNFTRDNKIYLRLEEEEPGQEILI